MGCTVFVITYHFFDCFIFINYIKVVEGSNSFDIFLPEPGTK